jgi:hypothetical protein
MIVTEQELSALLQAHGWYLATPKKYNTRYFYAKKREGNTVKSKYLKTEAKLNELTPEFVLERITS